MHDPFPFLNPKGNLKSRTSPLRPSRDVRLRWLLDRWRGRSCSECLGLRPCWFPFGSFTDDTPGRFYCRNDLWLRRRRQRRSFDCLISDKDSFFPKVHTKQRTGGFHSGWNSPFSLNLVLTAISSAISLVFFFVLSLWKKNKKASETHYSSCRRWSRSLPISESRYLTSCAIPLVKSLTVLRLRTDQVSPGSMAPGIKRRSRYLKLFAGG